MDLELYSDISPLTGDEARKGVKLLQSNPLYIQNLLAILLDNKKPDYKEKVMRQTKEIVEVLNKVNNYDDFQKYITSGFFIPAMLDRSVTDLSFSGLENLSDNDAYLFFSNHRDIVLDCALLDYALLKNNKQLCEMAFGDNLMSSKAAETLFRLNGGIVVKRTLPLREKYKESIRLSKYFCETILDRNKSIWVAQKSGRAKDGIDLTSPAIIKMLYLSMKKSNYTFSELINQCRITPVAVSYEYDPCDINKSREEVTKILNEGNYNKKKYEDLISLVKGLRQFKGRIHIHVGKPLVDKEYETHEEVAREIDRQIHLNYKLWPTNLFAYDYLENTTRFKDGYSEFDTDKFLSRFSHLSDDVKKYVLNAYANPVRSYISEIENEN
ncbi:MAG: 1-acyl-sn-glycerol-3-phosphate acyltransferase [Pleomorphochaeta sp.]